jgi:hypothetical protein
MTAKEEPSESKPQGKASPGSLTAAAVLGNFRPMIAGADAKKLEKACSPNLNQPPQRSARVVRWLEDRTALINEFRALQGKGEPASAAILRRFRKLKQTIPDSREWGCDALIQEQSFTADACLVQGEPLNREEARVQYEKYRDSEELGKLLSSRRNLSLEVHALTGREKKIWEVVQRGSRGMQYCRELHAAGLRPRRRWITRNCPGTYIAAGRDKYWLGMIQDEKSKVRHKAELLSQ